MLVIVFRAHIGGRCRVNLPTPRERVREVLKCDESRLEWVLDMIAPEFAPLMAGENA